MGGCLRPPSPPMVGIVPKMVVVDGHGPQLSKEPSFVHVRQLEKAVHKKNLKRHGSPPVHYSKCIYVKYFGLKGI